MTQRRIFLVPLLGAADVRRHVEHWEQRHAPLFAKTPGLLGYVQYRPLEEEWGRGLRSVSSETTFDSRQSEAAAYATAFYRNQVTPDEASFLDREAAWSARIVPVEPSAAPTAPRPTARYAVLRLGGSSPGPDWETLQVSRDAPGGGPQIHLLRADDRREALAHSLGADVPSFACQPEVVL